MVILFIPNGSGKVYLDGDFSSGGVAVSDGLVEIKTGTGNVLQKLNFIVKQFKCSRTNFTGCTTFCC